MGLPLISGRQLPGADHMERDSDNYVEVTVDVGEVTSFVLTGVCMWNAL